MTPCTDDPQQTALSDLILLSHVTPPQHLPRPQHQPEKELDNELADIKSSGWESEHGHKHLPGERKRDWEGNILYLLSLLDSHANSAFY